MSRIHYAIIILFSMIILATGIIAYTEPPKDSKPVACTLEAMICPDGSAVGRSGPNCEFAACPEPVATSTATHTPSEPPLIKGTLIGRVTLSPVCPVERNPPEPQCEPKPYETTVHAYWSNNRIATTKSDAQGKFEMKLAPGNYWIVVEGGTVMPTCQDKQADIAANETTEIEISCDTGIR